jgi:hypothetical protein
MEKINAKSSPPGMKLFAERTDMEHIWEVRESGLGATAFVPGEPDTWPGWEDSAVAPELFGGYLRDLRKLYDKYEYNPALYGHFGQGCVHCRVDFDLKSEPGIRKWRSFMEEATDLCVEYGGSLRGEHGDGQARGEFLRKMFGTELIEAFREFKSIWDPQWRMNPGKIVDPFRMDENLRLGAAHRRLEPETHFRFPEDNGSFVHATLPCVGIDKCRRKKGGAAEDDTMCPSNMVTHEERHTTRGRAHQLREMLHGDVIRDGWRDEAIMRLHNEEAVMKQIGLNFQVLDSGCCGMAGSFGYESDKYEVSLQFGSIRYCLRCGRKPHLPSSSLTDSVAVSRSPNRQIGTPCTLQRLCNCRKSRLVLSMETVRKPVWLAAGGQV